MKHPHAELMLEYAKDAMQDIELLKNWQFKPKEVSESGWGDIDRPSWREDYQYRRKPKLYEPTPLDQALELEIEAARLRSNHYGDGQPDTFLNHANKFANLKSLRSPAMIEHLKQQGKL